MTTPYKDAAFRYLTHGWKGPLPVGTQPRQKTQPPTGYTGNGGIWPTEDQIAEWVKARPEVNIALRLPEHVIGIDVDDYDNKPGAETMVATTRQHGMLPRTWVSTSREGHSGIRWFRLPSPGVLPGKLVHPDDQDISGVEIIQHTHRYAIVAPSIHPGGGQYRWVTPEPTDQDIPKPSDFPIIPEAWIDHIKQDCSCWAPYQWDQYITERNDPVIDAYQKWSKRITEAYGRHDGALGGVMALVAFKERGWPGAEHHLEQLQADFLRALGESRNPQEAEAEWQRMIEGAEKKASNSRISQWQAHPNAQPITPDTFDNRVREELDKLRIRDTARRMFNQEAYPPQATPPILTLQDRLAKPHPPVKWRIEGWQPIGSRVLLAAQFKAGKTTLTGNLARCLVDHEPWLGTSNVTPVTTGYVTIADFEMGERQIDAWLQDQGIEHDHKIYVIPLRGRAGTFNILDETIRKEWIARLRGTEYLILDCLRPILDALGLDEHREAGRFLTAFDTLCEEADIEDSLVVHHMGHQGERSRGDSRLRDWPDVEWRLVRENEDPASPRYLSAYGRDVEQSEAELHHDPDTRHLTLIGGSRANAAARASIPDIIGFLREHGQVPKTTVTKGVDHADHAVREGIKLAIRDGLVLQEVGKHGAHLLRIPQLGSSSDLVTARHDKLPSSSAPYRADEVETELEELPEGACSSCHHPLPGNHFYNCPTLEATTAVEDLEALPDPW